MASQRGFEPPTPRLGEKSFKFQNQSVFFKTLVFSNKIEIFLKFNFQYKVWILNNFKYNYLIVATKSRHPTLKFYPN